MTLIKRTQNVPAWPGFFNEFFDRDWLDWTNRNFSNTNTTLPAVNIKESADRFEVEMAAPGFEKGDFKIELNKDILTISSEKKVEKETKDDQAFTRREFSYQSFCRSFSLPDSTDRDNISARYDNGILKVEIPKMDHAKEKPVRAIEIQ